MTREITFAGIDDMNRPVFKVITNGAKPYYMGDCYNLFPWGAIEEGVKRFYKETPRERVDLRFFGDHFDCDPDGRRLIPAVIEDFYKYINAEK